jgi:hypothetical protein
MIGVIETYNAVSDKVKQEENGELSFSSFNIKSKQAEIKLLDFITGDIEGLKPPEPYNNEKIRDWATIFITTRTAQVENGLFAKGSDFYRFESLVMIGDYRDEVCGKDVFVSKGDTPIEVLDAQQFDSRCQTFIKRLQPSDKKPISKMVGENFICQPKDLGSVKLEYVRYPVFAEIKVAYDPVYNQDIPNETTSINYEWPTYAFPLLVWLISQMYGISTRENALAQQLQVEGKSIRG